MGKIKFTLDAKRGLVEEWVEGEDAIAEFAASGIEKSVYARKDYVDSLTFGSGSGGNVSLTGSNVFGSSVTDIHEFTGSVVLNNGITGSLLGTASFASDADKLDGLNSTDFAILTASNIFLEDQIIDGNLSVISGTFSGDLTVSGDLIINGTTTTINTTTLSVEDKNIELGVISGSSPTDVTANGGGIIVKGTTDKSILWQSSSAAGIPLTRWEISDDLLPTSANAFDLGSPNRNWKSAYLFDAFLGGSTTSLRSLGTSSFSGPVTMSAGLNVGRDAIYGVASTLTFNGTTATFNGTTNIAGTNTNFNGANITFNNTLANFRATNINFIKLDQTSSAGYVHALGEITSSLRVSAPSLTGSLLGTASFASDSDKLDGLNSTDFAILTASNIFSGNQTISGTLNISGSTNVDGLFTANSLETNSITVNNFGTIFTQGNIIGSNLTVVGNSLFNGSTNNFATPITASIISGSNAIFTNLSASAASINYIDFNTTSTAPSFQTGRLYYDQGTGDLQYNTPVSPNSINIGQQTVIKVKNTTNATINKGKLVRISGGQGANPLISTASYENDNNSANTLGMVMNNIADNQFGYVLLEGVISGLNLDPGSPSLYTAGQVLFLSSSGDYTNIAPTSPKHSVRLGEVVQAHQNQGVAFIRVQNGYEIDELHDVLITSPTNGDLIKYNSTTSVWENTKNLSGSYQLTGSLLLSGTISQNNQAVTKEYVDSIAAGKIDGSIADSEIAFGVGTSISGDANLFWNAGSDTLTIISLNQALKVNSEIDGEFLNINTTDYSINVIDPLIPGGNNTTITPFDIAIGDGGSSSANLNAGIVSVTDNSTSNTLSLRIPSGDATIKSVDSGSNLQSLNFEINELRINSDPGSSGQVLTSQGIGSAPIWTTISSGTSITPTGVIFVSKNGNNSNSGSLDSPVLTIGNALSKLKSHVSGASNLNRGVVLVAPGTYTENITIEDKNIIISGLTNDKEDQAVQFVGNIIIHATGSRGSTLDSVGIHNIKINDLSSSNSHLISLTGSASNANGIFLTLQNVLVAKVNSASSNASGLFIDTSFSNRVRIQDCRFLDQNGGGSPLVHFKNSGASALIDIYDTKFECSVSGSNLSAGSLMKTEGNCLLTAVDRCIFDTNSLSGAINIGVISAGSAANISNCSIITTNTGSNGIKIPVATNIVAIRNVFTVTGSATNICISGSGGLIAHAQNIATPTVVPAFNYSTVITGSNKVPYTTLS